MAEESDGTSSSGPGSGPPSFPDGAAAGGPPVAPPPPPPESETAAPPSYPAPPPGGFFVPPQATYAQGPGLSGASPYASWGIRLGGYLIDIVILIPVLVVLLVVFRHTHTLEVRMVIKQHGTHNQRKEISLLPFIITGVVNLVYATILCGGKRGQTVGMMAVGIRVVRAETMAVLGYGRALGRALIEGVLRLLGIVRAVLGILLLVDLLWPLWDKRNQTLHDKVVGSVVVRTKNPG
jgi:uncharacterized RDD family membrane protein YckC